MKPYLPIALAIGALAGHNAFGQEGGSGLTLAPSAPVETLTAQLREQRSAQPSPQPQGKRLEIRPAGDPIFMVDEQDWDGAEWRTYRRPKVDPVSHDAAGLALQGYDPVSYFENLPARGRKDFFLNHEGLEWRFASDEHRRMFEADPKRYIPAYGGFCAYSIGRGYPATAQPETFVIADGTLFLFFDAAARKVWEQDRASLVARANRNWPKLHR